MKDFLFLHYGPAGNSELEQIFFKNSKKIDFWNQPECKTINELIDATQQKVDALFATSTAPHIIAHSFGCTLLLNALKAEQARQLKVTLISPVPNFFLGFLNLAEKLVQLEPCPSIQTSLLAMKENPCRENFWPLCGAVVQSPHFEKLYWRSASAFETYQTLQKQSRPLRMNEWMTLMNEIFSFTRNKPTLQFKGVEIYLGLEDPYLKKSDVSWWQEVWPGAKVHTVEAGHYPHFENPHLFKEIFC